MYVTVILVGLGALVVLGSLIGAANGRAQSQAWRDVAEARHANWADRQRQVEEQRARDEEMAELVRLAEFCDCQVCRLLHGRGWRS
jgi:hypothetical protein